MNEKLRNILVVLFVTLISSGAVAATNVMPKIDAGKGLVRTIGTNDILVNGYGIPYAAGSLAWGTISGNITNQSDLWTELTNRYTISQINSMLSNSNNWNYAYDWVQSNSVDAHFVNSFDVGVNNMITGPKSLSVGDNNMSKGLSSASIGSFNQATGDFSVVFGYANLSGGYAASILGGENNIADGIDSIASGNNARSLHDNSFVWSDGIIASSTTNNQFTVHANNGVSFLGTARPQWNGTNLLITGEGGGGSGGGSWGSITGNITAQTDMWNNLVLGSNAWTWVNSNSNLVAVKSNAVFYGLHPTVNGTNVLLQGELAAATWGSITGTMSTQTDMWNYLVLGSNASLMGLASTLSNGNNAVGLSITNIANLSGGTATVTKVILNGYDVDAGYTNTTVFGITNSFSTNFVISGLVWNQGHIVNGKIYIASTNDFVVPGAFSKTGTIDLYRNSSRRGDQRIYDDQYSLFCVLITNSVGVGATSLTVADGTPFYPNINIAIYAMGLTNEFLVVTNVIGNTLYLQDPTIASHAVSNGVSYVREFNGAYWDESRSNSIYGTASFLSSSSVNIGIQLIYGGK